MSLLSSSAMRRARRRVRATIAMYSAPSESSCSMLTTTALHAILLQATSGRFRRVVVGEVAMDYQSRRSALSAGVKVGGEPPGGAPDRRGQVRTRARGVQPPGKEDARPASKLTPGRFAGQPDLSGCCVEVGEQGADLVHGRLGIPAILVARDEGDDLPTTGCPGPPMTGRRTPAAGAGAGNPRSVSKMRNACSHATRLTATVTESAPGASGTPRRPPPGIPRQSASHARPSLAAITLGRMLRPYSSEGHRARLPPAHCLIVSSRRPLPGRGELPAPLSGAATDRIRSCRD